MTIDLNTLSPKTIVELFNLVAEKPTKKFESKTVGIKRLTAALAAANSEVFETSGEYDVRPIPAPEPVKIEVDHSASNALIANAIANNPELAAMVKVDEPKKARKAKATKTEGKKRTGRVTHLTGKKLTILREANPKRPGSKCNIRYEVYRESKTSDDFIRLCTERNLGSRREILGDLSWDSKMQFIKLS